MARRRYRDGVDELSPAIFDADGLPRSRRFGDVYFSREGGLAETQAVFLAGCGLPERWGGRRWFTVAELGFGTGLNIAALLALWQATRPPGAHLSIFSVEAEPLDADVAGQALAHWPELAAVTEPLLARWPGRRAGFHRVDLPEVAASLDLAVMDAADALAAWSGRADVWFLDGFAPALNPGMWSDAVLALVAARSAPGARAATYTVAGQVRRGLAAAGFDVQRRPGFGRKRERLEATAPGETPAEAPPPRVAIVGAGIAGASLARAFAASGVPARVFDAVGPGAGASGNPTALVTPRLDAGLAAPAQLYAQAFARAVRLYGQLPGAVIERGVLQLESAPRDGVRFAKIAASDLFAPGGLTPVDAGAAGDALSEPASAGLRMRDALVIEPAAVLTAWLPTLETARIAGVIPTEAGWRLQDEAGDIVCEADVVCLAAGAERARLWPEAPIQPVRGQLSWVRGVSGPAVAWGAYAAPTRDGLSFGATHDRDDTDAGWRADDDRRNREALAARLPALAARLEGAAVEGRASIRATTPDRLPIAGEVAPGLLALGGLGSRGFTLAPLLAEHLAALALGTPSPLPQALQRVVTPERFARRAQRRGLVGAPGRV
jgi:tRNA 5-methylaminomethyl-2-thiouridine biosynthesis bifunctional protein